MHRKLTRKKLKKLKSEMFKTPTQRDNYKRNLARIHDRRKRKRQIKHLAVILERDYYTIYIENTWKLRNKTLKDLKVYYGVKDLIDNSFRFFTTNVIALDRKTCEPVGIGIDWFTGNISHTNIYGYCDRSKIIDLFHAILDNLNDEE